MNGTLYRLEVTRLLRTHTLLLMLLAFAAFGVVGPLLAYFMEDLLRLADPGGEMATMGLQIPPMTAVDALGSHLELVVPLGVLVVVLTATMALTMDSSPGRSVFYRSRMVRAADLLLPRFFVPTAAAVLAHLVGALVAWAVTSVLFGPQPVTVLLGAWMGGLYLAFAVSVVALVSSLVRSLLATVGLSVLVLVVFSGIGWLPYLSAWSPGALLQGLVLPAAGESLTGLFPAMAFTALLTTVAVTVAVSRIGAREV